MLRQIYTAFFLKLLIELMSEAATKFLGNYLALMNIPNGATVASRSPVPQNQVTSIVADLVSFDLVETSKKKHAVSDTESYWSFTQGGVDMLKFIRARRLELTAEKAKRDKVVQGE